MLAGKHTVINAVARLFGKGVKKEYKLDYDPIKAKTGYRELNRREQAIKKDLADTLLKNTVKRCKLSTSKLVALS
ncbi:hypothetical protein [Helicobacter mehlei]|uniref:Uncharacterized protein n=1 Tax=Helicobacter mehlei TaxID=2316080 RepID=A0A553UIC9_9HELI|nr:hypothetical protein [Helicobacter mehlei]TSA79953.1 hypothetical protein FNE76_07725 [Helicobacter mehlei]